MKEMSHLLLVFILGLSCVHGTTPYTCYSCTSCGELSSTDTSTSCKYCQKLWVNYVVYASTYRMCGNEDSCSGYDRRVFGIGPVSSCCSGDLCNQAVSLQKPINLIIFLSSLTIYFKL